jgi:hypothetical protein
MTHFKVNERDIFFILKEQLHYGALCRLERYRELDEATLDMLEWSLLFRKLEKAGASNLRTAECIARPSSKRLLGDTEKTAGSLLHAMRRTVVRVFHT